jgi:hypothetical protein
MPEPPLGDVYGVHTHVLMFDMLCSRCWMDPEHVVWCHVPPSWGGCGMQHLTRVV